MKQTQDDYGLKLKNLPIYYDNTNSITLSENPMQHSKTKKMDIRHYRHLILHLNLNLHFYIKLQNFEKTKKSKNKDKKNQIKIKN